MCGKIIIIILRAVFSEPFPYSACILTVTRMAQYLTDAWTIFTAQIRSMSFLDILDIAVVSIVLYFSFKFIRDRRAGKLALGVLLLVLMQIVSELMELVALRFIMQNVFQVGMLALVIVFQPELRSVLEKIGGEPFKGIMSIAEQRDTQSMGHMINDICEAVFDMSKDKTGALIVIERSTKLGDVIKTGTLLNADMSPFLLKNIFFNKAPMHDGAVVIRGTRVYAAGCFLPLSSNADIIKDLGTRHRTAIGMSENSDALVIVVSEETGVVSTACEGRLKRNYDYLTLRHELEDALEEGKSQGKTGRFISRRTKNKSGAGNGNSAKTH